MEIYGVSRGLTEIGGVSIIESTHFLFFRLYRLVNFDDVGELEIDSQANNKGNELLLH